MAIDYGKKRTGLAITDSLRIIANGLATVPSHQVIDYLSKYIQNEEVDLFVVGEPRDMMNKPSDASQFTEPFAKRLAKVFPQIPVMRYDERFTSRMAFQAMIDAGLGKKKRQDKALVDTISATIILQSYLEHLKNQH